MLGRHHLALTVLTSAIIAFPLFPGEAWFIALLGASIGSLIPDSDSPDAMIFHNRVKSIGGEADDLINKYFAPLFPIFGYSTKYLIHKPLILFYKFLGLEVEEKHRGLMHSILGIFSFALITWAVSLAVLWFLEMNIAFSIYFITFYIFGALMHVFEDSMTVSGIAWFYPFSEIKLKGRIRTTTDRRDSLPLDIFSSVLLGLTSLIYFDNSLTFFAGLGAIFVWIVLIYYSGLSLER